MLIDQIKPEILVRLDENYEEYNLCVNSVYDKLSTKCNIQPTRNLRRKRYNYFCQPRY